MADEMGVHNEVGGGVTGSLVQAGIIHQVTLLQQTQRQTRPKPRQLPPAVRDLTGRSNLVNEMDASLPKEKDQPINSPTILALDGIPGVGKTALAVWWAHRVQHRFPDGTLFANLHGYGPGLPLEPAVAITSFLQAFGVAVELIPSDLDTLIGLYRSVLGQRRVLVVLDNAASADQVQPLLPGSAGCLVVITSRNTLTGLVVSGIAQRVPVDVLTLADATALVHGVIGLDRVTAEPVAVAQLVNMCGRLPLALRVAASRVAGRPHVTVADIVEDLAHDDGRSNALDVRKDENVAVRTVLNWSYVRLGADDARTFRLLGLHPTPEFGLHAAAAFTGLKPATIRRVLEGLVEDHMVEPVGHNRYRFHDLLHVYAAHRAGVDEAPHDRLRASATGLMWYAQTATTADRLVFPTQPALAVELDPVAHPLAMTLPGQAWEWLITEQPTLLAGLRQALERGLHRIAIAIAATMRFVALCPSALWPIRLEADTGGLSAARACGDRIAEGIFLRRRADTHQVLGQWADSDNDLHDTIALADQVGDTVLRGEALCGLGRNRKLQQRYTEAKTYYRQALPLVRNVGNRYVEAVVECNLSQINACLGHYQNALAHAARELILRRDQEDPLGEGYALHDLAVARQGLGDHQIAIDLGNSAVAIYRTAVGADLYLARALETLALSLENTGDSRQAAQHLNEAIAILTRRRDPHSDALRSRMRDLKTSDSPRAPTRSPFSGKPSSP